MRYVVTIEKIGGPVISRKIITETELEDYINNIFDTHKDIFV